MGANRGLVAVIGAGPAGMAAAKHLRDANYQVSVFEQRPNVGGLWCPSNDPRITSATEGTKLQISKYITCMTDHPYPEDYPTYLGREELYDYYRSYAERFKLYAIIEFNARVETVERSSDNRQWLVSIQGEESPRPFDKIVWATGTETVPLLPEIEGASTFRGSIAHVQAYKRASTYLLKRVVVVGIGNSAGDTAVELAPIASKVYLAHRRGSKIIPRLSDGRPFDAILSWGVVLFANWLEHYLPLLYVWIINILFNRQIRKAWGPQPASWGFEPSPRVGQDIAAPCINDHLIPLVRDGAIVSVPMVRRISGPHAVELDNGEILQDIHAIIVCTGYKPDFGPLASVIETMLDPSFSPIPKLYMNIFPPRHADSVACLNFVQFAQNAATLRELMAMAVLQVWLGNSPLPSPTQMEGVTAAYSAWVATKRRKNPSLYDGWVQPYTFQRWLHGAAGTGMYEHVGWCSRAAWRLWWQDRELYRLVAGGVLSPHLYRLFGTGKRPVWRGAREEVVKVNAQLARDYPSGK